MQYVVRKEIPDEARVELAVYPEIIRHLLWHRGIKNKKDAEVFLFPDYNRDLHNPFEIHDMERAVGRILKAIDANEKIILYGDYDADGIPGSVVLHDFFKKIGYKNFLNYIPHRYREGYSLNNGAIEQFSKDGVSLLITIDSGITDIAEINHANKLGVDVIVTDHHLPLTDEKGAQILPEAYAVINSKKDNCEYRFDQLCGAGTAFKLVQGILTRRDFGLPNGWEKWLLDVVGISTVADMVPLIGENRALAHFGIKVLRKSPRPGLQMLLRKMKVNQTHITEDDIGFMIAPRINAASRMGEPFDAFEMLSTEDDARGGALAQHLNKLNDQRKGKVAAIVKEAKKRLSSRELRDVIVLGDPEWMPGLLGLVANSLAEAHRRPVFVWGREGGDEIKGSCRSNNGVSIVALMSAVSGGVFSDFGGHHNAGGFSVSHESVHKLEDELLRAYHKLESKEEEKTIIYDAKLSLDEITNDFIDNIEKLAPFGIGNEKPLFLFERVSPKRVEYFGKTKEHIKLIFKNNFGEIAAISFFSAEKWNIKNGDIINIIAFLEKSFFGGRFELRLRLVDVI